MNTKNPLRTQIGGEHYKNCTIQPVEFIEANDLKFLEGCVVKRVTRHDKPTGKGRQDIEKAIHELQLLLSLRYSEQTRDDREFPLVAHALPGPEIALALRQLPPEVQVMCFGHTVPTPPGRMTWQDVAKLSAVHPVYIRRVGGTGWALVMPTKGGDDYTIINREGVLFDIVESVEP